ncbi:MtrB/PioB family outer membrane beta-barrel protein [Candidatus Poribacteria bacterium]|nr:MtrB/PioB family outer membrane beta-barrel protein [Candidatus Poribacteria bacterium]
MKAARKLLPTLLLGLLVTMVVSVPAVAQNDPLEDLNSRHYPYGAEGPDGWYYGWYARGGATFYDVNGDEGRFREDRFIKDQLTGGIEQLSYSKENWNVSVRAIVPDNYSADAHYLKPDVFRLDLDFSRHRKYYDLISEAWNPAPAFYGLTDDFAEAGDDDLFADRTDLNLEGQLLIPEIPNIILGWHHWERTGDEALARGGDAISISPDVPTRGAIPVTNDLDGKSDTVYAEIPVTFREKYNFKLRQEYETFRDDQRAATTTFFDGAPIATSVHDDEPEWREFRTLFVFDGFLTENVYATASYYHSDLENEFERNELDPGSAFQTFTDNDVDNDRVSDTLTLGLVVFNIAKDLTLHTNFRAENSDTDGDSFGNEFGTPTVNASDTDETRLGESLTLVWQGFSHTTITLDGEWEQRSLDIKEVVENEFSRDANIDHAKQQYTFTVVNRPRRDLRLTARYRFKDNDENYDEDFDLEPDEYPGILGDLEQDSHEITLKGDWQFLPTWTTTLEYQFKSADGQFDIQNTEGQELDVHRISGTVFGTPTERLILTGMVAYENFQLDTPTDEPPGNEWQDGTGAYDTHYDSYVLFGRAKYVISEKWSTDLSYQHTENTGRDVNNNLDEVWVGADYELAEGKTLSARYEFFDFDDGLGDGFDDYDGHGIYLAFACRF